jgi:hypothetical protein
VLVVSESLRNARIASSSFQDAVKALLNTPPPPENLGPPTAKKKTSKKR